MKRFTYLFSLTLAAFAIAAVGFIGCEGPAGATGAAGADGADGEDGADANATCTECHDESTDVFVKTLQSGNSKHMTGTAFERSDADCAACHTHEGFIDRMESGEMEASAAISDPSPPNCRTCHKIHINYDATDFAIRYDDPVTLWINDVTLAIGSGNVCSNCHQPRIPEPMFGESADSLTITNKRWGPHHGPQSAMLYGTSAYEVTGTVNYPTPGGSTHASAGCVQCHMPDAYGAQAGGHTFAMSYEYHGSDADWVDGCVTCHTSIKDFDYNSVQTNVSELTDSLHHLLITEGLVDSSGYLVASSTSPLKVSQEEAGLLYNFKFIEEDLSEGVHNPGYTMALLQNSIEALSAN